ncbi:MAG TPA: autotransporter outer membrane beta-barrel domain-containing protein, partial [Pseudolabrys sp.]|nr:autotransporter outer membrane beta-barrel domain-containing protein [Pseudolabrys sp.]
MTFVSKKSGSKKIVWRIAAALMVSAAPFAMSEKVSAQSCTPATSAANPVNNTTITCTGGTITANGSAGYGTGNEAGNQVTVDSSATVTGAVNGFLLGDANTITNNGTIAASGANGVAINAAIPGGSADVTVTNSKTIQATASGGTAIQASQVFLFNAATGTISADSVAVNGTGLSGSSVSMAAGGRGNFGLIEATGAGGIAIKSAADVNIENFGRIEAKTAGGTAIQAANRALGVNRAGGTITGGATGISAATLDVTNDGTISGGSVGITGAGSITNSGAISGGTVPGQGSVVFIGAGINTLTLQTGSKLTGDAVGSTSGATNKLVLQGSGTADNNFLNFNLLDVQATTAWALNGNADVQTATVSSGTLIVDTSGTLNGNVTINSGTQLTGTGKIAGNVNVMQKALLAPGAGIGKLTVTGNVNFAPDSIFFITATPARTSTSLAVGGNAVLAGSVQVQALGNFKPTTMYTILTAAGGLGGTRFDGGVSTTTASAFVTPTLSYDATDVFLTLDLINTPGAGAGFASAAQTRNQLAVASALDAAPTSNSLVGKLLILSADGARAAFNALSGEVFGSVHNTQAQEGSFTRSGVLGRLRQASYADAPGELGALGFAGPELAYADGRAPGNGNAAADGRTASAVDGKLAYAADANGSMAADLPVKAPRGGYNNGRDLTFWAQGLGGWGHSDSDGNAASLKSRFGGFLSGADMRFGEVWRAGLVAGYTRSDL